MINDTHAKDNYVFMKLNVKGNFDGKQQRGQGTKSPLKQSAVSKDPKFIAETR